MEDGMVRFSAGSTSGNILTEPCYMTPFQAVVAQLVLFQQVRPLVILIQQLQQHITCFGQVHPLADIAAGRRLDFLW